MTQPSPPLRGRPLAPPQFVRGCRREISVGSRAGIAAEEVRRSATSAQPRPFQLVRRVDVSGVSGTGVVAEGVQFTDGSVALRWPGATPATSIWEHGIESMLAVHGHGDASVVEWLDDSSIAADADVLMPEFEALRALATRVINEHVDDCGLCAVCGSAFPCELAVLAEHNLALL